MRKPGNLPNVTGTTETRLNDLDAKPGFCCPGHKYISFADKPFGNLFDFWLRELNIIFIIKFCISSWFIMTVAGQKESFIFSLNFLLIHFLYLNKLPMFQHTRNFWIQYKSLNIYMHFSDSLVCYSIKPSPFTSLNEILLIELRIAWIMIWNLKTQKLFTFLIILLWKDTPCAFTPLTHTFEAQPARREWFTWVPSATSRVLEPTCP